MRGLVLLMAFGPGVIVFSPLLAQMQIQTPSPTPAAPQSLPAAPSSLLAEAVTTSLGLPMPSPGDAVMAGFVVSPRLPCRPASANPPAGPAQEISPLCSPEKPTALFVNSPAPAPLTSTQKGELAIHAFKSPGNLLTVVGTAGYTIGTDSHTAYGPGWRGFGRNVGDSLLQDATGTFFGTYLIPSLLHQDPRYHRMPNATIPRRVLHVFASTFVAYHDDGTRMPNYANLLTNPICNEISNLYVPGIQPNGPSTVARIMTGFATDPEDTLITEFLPDVAKHVHVHVIFVQRILNPVASQSYPLQ